MHVGVSGWDDMSLLVVFDASGEVLWSMQATTDDWILAEDGTLYSGLVKRLEGSRVMRLQGSAKLAHSTWPALRGSPRRAGVR